MEFADWGDGATEHAHDLDQAGFDSENYRLICDEGDFSCYIEEKVNADWDGWVTLGTLEDWGDPSASAQSLVDALPEGYRVVYDHGEFCVEKHVEAE